MKYNLSHLELNITRHRSQKDVFQLTVNAVNAPDLSESQRNSLNGVHC